MTTYNVIYTKLHNDVVQEPLRYIITVSEVSFEINSKLQTFASINS